ncbi:MAG: hypothetical protein ABRQ27_14695 [Clostridiaceae bacterium]
MNRQEKNIKKLNPSEISLPQGFKIDIFAQGLDSPVSMVFTDKGDMLVGDAGIVSGNPKVMKLTSSGFQVVADGFNIPMTGINYLDGSIYVSHRGFITVVKPDGTKQDIISGLPSFGDHSNNQVIFGIDGKMYFGQGTATNSGVVGLDNSWIKDHPFFHDYPGADIMLTGLNFKTRDIFSASPNSYTYTGAYSPFGVPTLSYQIDNGIVKASGSILRANLDGSNPELLAWGFRNPFRLKFDRSNRLFCTNLGADVRGSRPIKNSPDEFQMIMPGAWYGWPDYTGGLPVTLPQFKAEGKAQPEFLLASHPMIPPTPFAQFIPHTDIMGFDFDYNSNFGPYGDAYIAKFGMEVQQTAPVNPPYKTGPGILRISMNTGKVTTFAVNKSGLPVSPAGITGFERPVDVVFGPDKAMYVLDFGTATKGGVIWKITKA